MPLDQLDESSLSEDPNGTPRLDRRWGTQQTHTVVSTRRMQQDVLISADATLSVALRPLQAWTRGRESLVVTTPTVHRLYGDQVSAALSGQSQLLVLDCDESSKDLAQVERVCSRACSMSLSRTGVLIGLGGGVCTDIATVAAAWIRRGVEHVRVPTTLVGLVDAGIGYKGAINFQGYKSYLGSFHAPRHVLIAPAFLHSLPPKHLREGFAEIIKIAVVCDAELFDLVELHAAELIRTAFRSPGTQGADLIWRAVQRMLEELEQNPFEDQTYERLVDFGHTFSPLIESASAHRLSHGEAVAIDIALTMLICEEMGLVESAPARRVLALLSALNLPVYSPLLTADLCKKSLQQAALHRGGRPNLVLPTAIGAACFLDSVTTVDTELLGRALRRLEAQHRSSASRGTNPRSCGTAVDDPDRGPCAERLPA